MRSMIVTLCATLAILIGGSEASLAGPNYGSFKGKVIASFLPDGRNMRLEQPFGYIDPKGKHWDVPAGEQTDGASIPKALWVMSPPFTGKYREAAVIHDYYCRRQAVSWQGTHNVFYDAMRAGGVDERTAKVMFAAVYNFGPRWGGSSTRRAAPGSEEPVSVERQQDFMRDLGRWVDRSNPSREQIVKAVETGAIPR